MTIATQGKLEELGEAFDAVHESFKKGGFSGNA